VVAGILTAEKWIEVDADDLTFGTRRCFGINFQRSQQVRTKKSSFALQGQIPRWLLRGLLREWNVPVVEFLHEFAAGRTVRRNRRLRPCLGEANCEDYEAASSADNARRVAGHRAEL
jgi:hypothetical protein